MARLYIGCAGWSIPKEHAGHFPGPATGTHLERYALRLTAAEINSSFYRSHRPQTYARWAASVPENFRFSVKMPREITHVRRLRAPEDPLALFVTEITALGPRLGPILIQLPPSLVFDTPLVNAFFSTLRGHFHDTVVCEPRHASWFAPDAEAVLVRHEIARVAADPAVVPEAALPGGWPGLIYYRLHGSPRIYYSAYDDAALGTLSEKLAASSAETWCIFDNTALGAATKNAVSITERLTEP